MCHESGGGSLRHAGAHAKAGRRRYGAVSRSMVSPHSPVKLCLKPPLPAPSGRCPLIPAHIPQRTEAASHSTGWMRSRGLARQPAKGSNSAMCPGDLPDGSRP